MTTADRDLETSRLRGDLEIVTAERDEYARRLYAADMHAAPKPAPEWDHGVEDERLTAWDEIVDHPFFKSCFDTDGPLLDAMVARLDEVQRIIENIWELCRTPDTVTRTTSTGHTYRDKAVTTDLLEYVLEGAPLPW